MKFKVVTLFPELFSSYSGVVGQAMDKGLLNVEALSPRDFTKDKHKTVDDRPYGGGDGMLMLAEPLLEALDFLSDQEGLGHIVYVSPQGKAWNDSMARDWAKNFDKVTIICGRYGGIDQRVIDLAVDEEVSIGDYVLSGGELAAQVLIDTTARFLPGVLGNEASPDKESFSTGLLESASFTRPQSIRGKTVPAALLSGHHEQIELWREMTSLLITGIKRPDLITDAKALQKAVHWGLEKDEESLQACGLSYEKIRGLQI